LEEHAFDLVLHLAGPFQGQDYSVAEACIAAGNTYIDMADSRAFVAGFSALDANAQNKKVALITGASTVPCLSSAILDEAIRDYSELHAIDYGICAGLKTGLGLATLQAVLSYCGRAFSVLTDKRATTTYGLSHPRFYDFPPPVGRRYIVDCDIPDFSLFPQRYATLSDIRFGSCMDAPGLAPLLSFRSLCVRHRWVRNWTFLLPCIRLLMRCMKPLGSRHSGFFMRVEGISKNGEAKKAVFEVLAQGGSGLEIPVTPVVILVKRMLQGYQPPAGAYPCMGLLTLDAFK
jgi:hypothetical protein